MPDATPADRVAWALVGAFLLVALGGLAVARLPFIDLPQHAATLAMLRHPDHYAADYVVQLVPWTTNSLWFTLDPLLAPLLSPEGSLKLLVALAVAGTPLSLAAWARAAGGRAAPAALLGCAAVFTRPLFWGFLHYALSLPVGVFVLALDLQAQRAGGPRSRRRWHAALAVALVALFLLHAQTLAFVFGALGLQRLAVALLGDGAGPRLRRLGDGLAGLAAACVPALALFALWVRDNLIAPAADEAPLGTLKAGLGAKYVALSEALGAFPLHLQGFLKGTGVDDVLALGLLVVGLLGWAVAAAQARRDPARRGPLVAALGVSLVAFALYLWMPIHIRGQYYLSTRMAPWVLFGLLPAVGLVRVGPRLAWVRVGAAAALAALALAGTGRALATFAEESAPVDALLDRVPPEQRLMLWASTRSSAAVPSNPFTHYLSWYVADQLGSTTFSFASFKPNPVVYRDRATVQRSIPGEEFKAWCTAFAGQATDVTWVVARGAAHPKKLCGAPTLYADHLALEAREGDWTLYRVTAPLPAVESECRCPRRR